MARTNSKCLCHSMKLSAKRKIDLILGKGKLKIVVWEDLRKHKDSADNEKR